MSEQKIRNWFLRRSGRETGAFHFSRDLTSAKNRLILLPDDLATLSIHLPLLRALAFQAKTQDSLLMLVRAEYLPLLKHLEIDKYCQAYDDSVFRFGHLGFNLLERRIKEQKWDLALSLDIQPNILKLYLLRSSSADYRVGFRCEEFYPFLNISLSGQGLGSALEYSSILAKQFQVTPKELLPYLAHDAVSQMSQNVILLNLEPSLNGIAWTAEEILKLHESARGQFRFLAVAIDPSHATALNSTLDKLGIRTAPGSASYHTFLDQLRQYRALVSLNSPHAMLATHLSQIPTLVFSEEILNFSSKTSISVIRSRLLSEEFTLQQWIPTEKPTNP